MPSRGNIYKFLLAFLTVLILVPAIFSFLGPPAVFPDAGMGFQVLRSMRLGAGFNMLIAPDQNDISQNYAEFLTWWSPGQYLVPYLFKLIFPINLGQATVLTVFAGGLSGLAGFYSFFKKIGFTPLVSAISLIFIFCQQASVVPYVFYNGGEILLFAFEGWFLYGCAAIKKPGVILALFVIFSGWLGFFCKSSFLWIYAAGLFCLWLRLPSGKSVTRLVKNGLWVGVPALLAVAAIYIFFLSRGPTPASVSNSIKITLQAVCFPLASPVLSGFSADDIIHGLIYHTGIPVLNPVESLIVLLLLAVVSVWFVVLIIFKIANREYRIFLLVFYCIAIIFFAIAYLRGLTISYEARHFRIIGILMVPGMIELVRKAKVVYQIFFGLIFFVIVYTSVLYLAARYQINKNFAARGRTGIAQLNIDQPSLNYLMRLDNENRNALFVFIGDDTGLEILNNRIITLQPVADNLKINTDDYRYDGHAGPLYIVLPKRYHGVKEKMILQSFPGYANFETRMLSSNYVLYSTR